MKRDYELIKLILVRLEGKPDVYSSTDMAFDGYTPTEVSYNAVLLREAGLVDGALTTTLGSKVPGIIVNRMTNAGHDLLDTLRNDTVMNRIMEKSGQKAVELPFDALVAAGKAIIVSLVS